MSPNIWASCDFELERHVFRMMRHARDAAEKHETRAQRLKIFICLHRKTMEKWRSEMEKRILKMCVCVVPSGSSALMGEVGNHTVRSFGTMKAGSSCRCRRGCAELPSDRDTNIIHDIL